MNIIDELRWRGAVNQTTDEADLRKLTDEKKISLYCGVDPTGDSLHIGPLNSVYDAETVPIARTPSGNFDWWWNWCDWRPIREELGT
jgi:hypothetical protein